ncbi:MAG TPA: ACT domain-containing protein, partial [Spirochaetota bacterium]|nr:ACT domain-containing protein [Spirochaetota bacterium]
VFEKKYEIVSVRKVAVISVLGSNIAQPGVLEKATKILAENKINVNCISQSLRQVNMQFVIDREQYAQAVTVLNAGLCINK